MEANLETVIRISIRPAPSSTQSQRRRRAGEEESRAARSHRSPRADPEPPRTHAPSPLGRRCRRRRRRSGTPGLGPLVNGGQTEATSLLKSALAMKRRAGWGPRPRPSPRRVPILWAIVPRCPSAESGLRSRPRLHRGLHGSAPGRRQPQALGSEGPAARDLGDLRKPRRGPGASARAQRARTLDRGRPLAHHGPQPGPWPLPRPAPILLPAFLGRLGPGGRGRPGSCLRRSRGGARRGPHLRPRPRRWPP